MRQKFLQKKENRDKDEQKVRDFSRKFGQSMVKERETALCKVHLRLPPDKTEKQQIRKKYKRHGGGVFDLGGNTETQLVPSDTLWIFDDI